MELSRPRRIISVIIVAILLITPVMANQPSPHVKISFGKPAEVLLGATAPILITIDALEKLDSVSVTITLPDGVELRSGNLERRMIALEKGGQLVLPVDIAIVDSIISRAVVSVWTRKDGIEETASRSLFFISYDGIVEILDIFEIVQQNERLWKTIQIDEEFSPPDQIILNNDLFSGTSDYPEKVVAFIDAPNKPFVTRLDPMVNSGGDTPPLALGKTLANTPMDISGRVQFRDSDGDLAPIYHASIAIYEYNESGTHTLLGGTGTDPEGYFNVEIDCGNGVAQPGPDIFFIIYSNHWYVHQYAEDIWGALTIYSVASNVISTFGAAASFGSHEVQTPFDQVFAVFSVLAESYNFIVDAALPFYTIDVIYPIINILVSSHMNPLTEVVHLEAEEWEVDNYDVIRHEFAHLIMKKGQGFWPIASYWPFHGFRETVSPALAWTEGWASAFPVFVYNDGTYHGWRVEDQTATTYPTGQTNEGRVAAALLDLYDDTPGNSFEDDAISIPFRKIFAAIEANTSAGADDFYEFWGKLSPTLSQNEKHYASRAIIDNTIDVDLEPPGLPPTTPAPPTGLTITNGAQVGRSVRLSWDANSEQNLDHYNVWRKCQYGVYFVDCNLHIIGSTTSTSYTDWEVFIDVNDGSTDKFTYYVTAVNDAGMESGYSNSALTWGSSFEKSTTADLVPITYALKGNYPNPFNPSTWIHYDLPEASRMSLVIYDVMGREIRGWTSIEEPGFNSLLWNGTNTAGQPVAGGVYIYRMVATSIATGERFVASEKMLFLK